MIGVCAQVRMPATGTFRSQSQRSLTIGTIAGSEKVPLTPKTMRSRKLVSPEARRLRAMQIDMLSPRNHVVPSARGKVKTSTATSAAATPASAP